MLAKLKTSTRMVLLAALGTIGLIIVYLFALFALRQCVLNGEKAKLTNLVEYAHTQLAYYDAQVKAGTLTLDQAQQQAKESLRSARYDHKEYFWINDLEPRSIMHPIKREIEGQDQSGNKDPNGKLIYVEFAKTAKEKGSGFVEYVSKKPQTQDIGKKLSYVKLYEPWGWVVGTGVYIDDVNAEFDEAAIRLGIIVLITTGILFILGQFIRRSIVDEFGGEPREAMKMARQIADGNLACELHVRQGDRTSLLFVLSQMQNNLRELLTAISKNSHDVQASLEKLSSESNQINIATQLQSSVVEGTRDGVSALSSSVETVTALAHDTEASSREVAARSQEGANIATKVAQEMESIASIVQRSSSEVTHLVTKMREINQMATVIKEIADQTNLLALNAAIEAARAGEQGRGFAVVADEVRKLAERTTHSTVEISQLLQSIESETTSVVSSMNEVTPVIESGVQESQMAASALRDIENYANVSLNKMQELVNSTTEQASRISEIVDQMDRVSESTARADEAIKQSHETASLLEKDADELFQMTQKFNIGADSLTTDKRGTSGQARPLIEWSSVLSVGFAEIDKQHQRLVEIANELNSAMHSGAGNQVAGRILGELVDYTVQHFAYEEGQMKKYNYPQAPGHFAAHKKLVTEVSAFKEKFDRGQAAVSIELMGFLRDWLLNHILKVDKSLGNFLAKR